ncbi:acetyl esterase/lipase [Pseudorhizobium tarimense]|uniref:Acetyl esterase/lipase n=1 Tax=Pseudorhizobium tarimense TaxID=1079109 RepID=A0ABV2H0I9_9HYPH|nr:alpha/beta hydrolase fold domain-containing protein [Pseudorhizobium tarimense]MCJ8517370.1 alpha/beta hydrolase [Pseudorhizobium tarimense]
MSLEFVGWEIRQAERFNRLLRFLPRYRTDRRWNARLIQTLLRAWDAVPRPFPPDDELTVEDRLIKGGDRPLKLRLIRPKGAPRGVYLTFHGGAWVMGTPRFDDRLNRAIAGNCRVAVASVDHHLAIDDRLDLAIADAHRAAEWAVTAGAEFGSRNIIVGGQSSGAHLAACALLHLRDLQTDARLSGAALFYGAYDMAGSPGLRNSSNRTLLIDGQAAFRNLQRLTSGLTDEERRNPRLSPLYADFSGLPPALFIAGELDPVFDDSIRMADRWNKANSNAELVAVPQGVHGFDRFPLAIARKTHRHLHRTINEWLRTDEHEARRHERQPCSQV